MLRTTDKTPKERLKKTLLKYTVILGISLLYLLFVLLTGWGIPCIFYTVTGWQCPGCGISRMLVSIAKLDFVSAFYHNPFLLVTSPILFGCLLLSEIRYVKRGDGSLGKWSILLWIEIVLALLFGVLRNIL